VYFDVHGPGDAQAVLMSSGLGGAAQYWDPNLQALSEKFRVITYDQFGTGRSPGNIREGYTIANMAQEVATLLDGLGIRSCPFVAHALGGLIGLELTCFRPALLNRLVLVHAWIKTHPHTLRCFAARKSLLLNTGISA
jgi:aminoacrylate hydrolase